MASHPSDLPQSSHAERFRPRLLDGRLRRTYSVAEVAELLGISRSTAYECVHRGEIPALRFGQRLVVPVDAIDDLLATRGPHRETWNTFGRTNR